VQELHKEEKNEGNIEKETIIFRDFREFGKNTEEGDKGKIGEEDDFVESVFKEVERLRESNKENK